MFILPSFPHSSQDSGFRGIIGNDVAVPGMSNTRNNDGSRRLGIDSIDMKFHCHSQSYLHLALLFYSTPVARLCESWNVCLSKI